MEGVESKKRRRGRDRERITDPETEEGKDGHTRERGRDNHGHSHIDMGRDTEMNRNCEPGPTQSSWQDGAWGLATAWLAPQNGCGHCCPEIITLQGMGLWAELSQTQEATPE